MFIILTFNLTIVDVYNLETSITYFIDIELFFIIANININMWI
jgi:hypothetical protein